MINIGRIFITILVILIPTILLIVLIIKKTKKSFRGLATPPENSPYISVLHTDGGLMDDGQCGYLDIECANGENSTVPLSFNKKTSNPFYIPLKVAQYRITYRTKSKAGMLASGALQTINENNGAMGSFANAIYDAGVGKTQLSSIVVDVDEKFVMKLNCTTNGFQKNCEVIS